MKLKSPKILQLKFRSARSQKVFNCFDEKDLLEIPDPRVIHHDQDHDQDSNASQIGRDTNWCIKDLYESTKEYQNQA